MRAASDSTVFRRWVLQLVIVLACSVFGAKNIILAAEAEVQVIPLKHRMAGEVVPVLQPLMLPGESITGMDTRLIVRASPTTHAQIMRVLAEVDVARRNLLISIRHGGERERIQTEQGLSGDLQSGNTRIIVSGNRSNSGGLTIGRSGPNGNVQYRSERRVTTGSDNSAQTLTVLDGHRAFLKVGESVPQVQTFLALAGHRLTVALGVQYYDVTTGFEVEPHLLGEQVQMAVTPRLAFRSSRGMQVVSFEELRTVVSVRPGEWVDLGSVAGSANNVNREIFGSTRSTRSENSRFLVRVDPL